MDKIEAKVQSLKSMVVIACFGRFGTASLMAESDRPAVEAIPPLYPPHPEIPAGFWEQHGVVLGLAAIIVAALLLGVVLWLRRPRPPVIIPPEVQAKRELQSLREQTESGATLSRISRIVRQYVTAAFDLPSGELTTTDFCRSISAQKQIGPELASAVTDFLTRCDIRKFSSPGLRPPLDAASEALKIVEQGETRREALRLAEHKAPALREE